MFGLVGPNGAGKTTMLSMAIGLLRPDTGHARILGVDVWQDPVWAKLWLVSFCALNTGNLCGFDGTALWHTLVTPHATRADVRGRQWGWVLVVGPLAVLTAAVLPAVFARPPAARAARQPVATSGAR